MQVKDALLLLSTHVEKHTSEKYQRSVINTENSLKEPVFTLLTSQKYLARYLANGGEKNAQTVDLLKAAHFILFELQNRIDDANKL